MRCSRDRRLAARLPQGPCRVLVGVVLVLVILMTAAIVGCGTKETTNGQAYGAGMYRVGSDLPAGLYKGATPGGVGATGMWTISSDAQGKQVVAKDVTFGQFYVEVQSGQYLKLFNVSISPATVTPVVDAPSSGITNGTYLVGVDIAAGTYAGTVTADAGQWSISSDANGQQVLSHGDPTSGEFTLQVKADEYLKVIGVTITR